MSEPVTDQKQPHVFLLAGGSDAAHARELFEMLDGKVAARVTLPFWEGTPAERQEDFETNVATCDALICVWGSSSPEWLRNALRDFIKLRDVRRQPLKMMLIATASPAAREAVSKITPVPKSAPVAEVPALIAKLFGKPA
jgi:hypothetical protein